MFTKILIMNLTNIIKYFFRFILLQAILTVLTIWYFDNFLIGSYLEGYDIILANLLEDRSRFYNFIPYDFVKIDFYLAFLILSFLIILYSTNFYSYVNELSLTYNKGLFDEFIPIYFIWTASFLSFFQVFRFTIVSRSYLALFSFIVPLILVIFRNTEFLSRILGRNPSKESYISFNLDQNSIANELRILKFRRSLINYELEYSEEKIKQNIENVNKINEINLIVLYLKNTTSFSQEFEHYLVNLNKKILILTPLSFEFSSKLLFRKSSVSNINIFYLNNDIQYGAKYIIKRSLDILITILISPLLIFLIILTTMFIQFKDGFPLIIKQKRIGLHGQEFSMFKLRTMRNLSHEQREDLKYLNKRNGPLFKIENDPRLIPGVNYLRKFSLDEIPQFINVLKGEMSLVGPRPLFPEDNQYFDEHYLRRLNVLPGITGLLQINERNTSDFETWYKYDLEYIENWSIWLDILIILKTPLSLIRSKTTGQ